MISKGSNPKIMARDPERATPETVPEDGTVPVIIDARRDLGDFRMTRCVYLAVDYDGLQADWLVGQPPASRILLAELAGVITAPEEGGLFTSKGQIERMFDEIEREAADGSFRWVIEFEDLWIPNRLIDEAIGEGENRPGTVLRVDADLIRAALRFAREQISLEHYRALCDAMASPVRLSPGETRAFRAWGKEEIGKGKAEYERLARADKIRPWRDAEGHLYVGSERWEEPVE